LKTQAVFNCQINIAAQRVTEGFSVWANAGLSGADEGGKFPVGGL
jgi:hypothetical protein